MFNRHTTTMYLAKQSSDNKASLSPYIVARDVVGNGEEDQRVKSNLEVQIRWSSHNQRIASICGHVQVVAARDGGPLQRALGRNVDLPGLCEELGCLAIKTQEIEQLSTMRGKLGSLQNLPSEGQAIKRHKAQILRPSAGGLLHAFVGASHEGLHVVSCSGVSKPRVKIFFSLFLSRK